MKGVLSLTILCLSFISMAQTRPLIKVDGKIIPFGEFSSFKLPNASLTIELQSKDKRDYSIYLGSELLTTMKTGTYTVSVPDQIGTLDVKVMSTQGEVILSLKLFVLTPISQKIGEYLNGFRIGMYPPALGEGGKYERPLGFIEVTKENMQTKLSPNFRLAQFIPNQKGKPKYLVIRTSLLHKLEYILKEVQQAGVNAKTLRIRMAYLTPQQNAAKGNAIYSRHIYGDAAQIIIDQNNDGIMDDVNKDGKTDMKDVRWLFDLINELSNKTDYQILEGGLAHYRLSKKFSGYVYIDARGNKMRF